MNWLNINTDTLRTTEFLGQEPRERGTWLCLIGWCCTQENGGIIEGAKLWKDRMWQQLCGVTKDEVETANSLFEFVDNDLHIYFYPIEQQSKVTTSRSNGKKGGRPPKKPTGNPEETQSITQPHNPELNVKESKVKEGNSKVSKEVAALPFGSEEFKDVWSEWLTYLKQKRKTPTQITITKQHKQLKTLSETDAINTINKSIQNGWQGLFPDEQRNGGRSANAGQANRSSAGHSTGAGEGINVPIL